MITYFLVGQPRHFLQLTPRSGQEPSGNSIFGYREYLIEFNNTNGDDLTVGSPVGFVGFMAIAEKSSCPKWKGFGS